MPTNQPICPLCNRAMPANSSSSGHLVSCNGCGRVYDTDQGHEYCPHCCCPSSDPPAAGDDPWRHDDALIWLAQFARREAAVEELTFKFDQLSLQHVSVEEYHEWVARELLAFLREGEQGRK